MFPSTNTLVSDFSGRSSEFVPDTDLLVFTDSVFILSIVYTNKSINPKDLYRNGDLRKTRLSHYTFKV